MTDKTDKAEQQRWVVDAIEEAVASIEVDGGRMITVPQSILPPGARQGHVLRVTIVVDDVETAKALAASSVQTKKYAKQPNDPGGDVAL